MFATVPRMRSFRQHPQQEQVEEKPELGMDSTYGVRSLASSWGGDSDSEAASDDTLQQTGTGTERAQGYEHGPEPVAHEQEQEMEVTTAAATAGAHDHHEWAPAAPSSETVDPSTPPPPSSSSAAVDHYLATSSTHGYLYNDDSAPSSPASFASMPSYMSSLSRTSSLAGTGRADMVPTGTGMGESEELVMPTVSVSSGSQLRPRANGSGRGLRIMLLGDQTGVDEFIAELRAKEVVQMSASDREGGEYAIIGGDEVVATIITGLTGEDIETRVEAAYPALDGVLHPDPSPAARAQLEELVLGYAAKSDWVHLLFVLDAESSTINALAGLMPTLAPASASTGSSERLLQLPPPSPLDALSSLLGPDPTPRPDFGAAQSYFAHRTNAAADMSPVHHLIHALSHGETIRRASSAKFFAWRPSPSSTIKRPEVDLSSSQTSASGLEAEAATMPTVARAQGGGEWEATLSRRLAKRRQPTAISASAAAGSSASSSSKRRISGSAAAKNSTKKKKPRDSCAPLFPSSHNSSVTRTGLTDLVDKTFGGLKRRWRWGVVAAAAAVALVVGWNWVRTV